MITLKIATKALRPKETRSEGLNEGLRNLCETSSLRAFVAELFLEIPS